MDGFNEWFNKFYYIKSVELLVFYVVFFIEKVAFEYRLK